MNMRRWSSVDSEGDMSGGVSDWVSDEAREAMERIAAQAEAERAKQPQPPVDLDDIELPPISDKALGEPLPPPERAPTSKKEAAPVHLAEKALENTEPAVEAKETASQHDRHGASRVHADKLHGSDEAGPAPRSPEHARKKSKPEHADAKHDQPKNGREAHKKRSEAHKAEFTGQGERFEDLATSTLENMLRKLEIELGRRNLNAADSSINKETALETEFTRDALSENSFASTAPDERGHRRVSRPAGPAGAPEIISFSHATESKTDAAEAAEAPKPAEQDTPDKPIATQEAATQEKSAETAVDKLKQEDLPNRFDLTWEQWLEHRPKRGGVVRTDFGFKDLTDENSHLEKFTTEEKYVNSIMGREWPKDVDYHPSEGAQPHYDQVGGIDNNDKVHDGPDYEKMTLVELARELGKTMYQYQHTGDGSEVTYDPEIPKLQKKIRDQAEKLYRKKDKQAGDQYLTDERAAKAHEIDLASFEAMADRYLRTQLERDAETAEASRDTYKKKFDRFWASTKSRFGVKHWEDGWNEPDKTNKALNKDVTEDMSEEEREEKQQKNRYNTILGRIATFAEARKEKKNKPSGFAETWKIHASEMARDFPKDYKLDKYGELVPLNDTVSEAAQKRYKEITELRYRR